MKYSFAPLPEESSQSKCCAFSQTSSPHAYAAAAPPTVANCCPTASSCLSYLSPGFSPPLSTFSFLPPDFYHRHLPLLHFPTDLLQQTYFLLSFLVSLLQDVRLAGCWSLYLPVMPTFPSLPQPSALRLICFSILFDYAPPAHSVLIKPATLEVRHFLNLTSRTVLLFFLVLYVIVQQVAVLILWIEPAIGSQNGSKMP